MWAFPRHAAAQSETTVSIEQQDARADKSVDVPVQVTNFTNIGAISLVITYDPSVLEFARSAGTSSLIAGTPRENFSANVVKPGELRISWFDPTGARPIKIDDGVLLSITFHRYAGGRSSVSFTERSEISDIKAEPIGVTFQDGRVGQN
jgi:Cohesin domain.